jgi:hypothetical protein
MDRPSWMIGDNVQEHMLSASAGKVLHLWHVIQEGVT